MPEHVIIEEVGKLLNEAMEIRRSGDPGRASRRLHTAARLLESHRLHQLPAIVAIVDAEQAKRSGRLG
jgi:hypothetical protein